MARAEGSRYLNGAARAVLAAQLLSGIGDWAMLLLLGVWASDLTGAASTAGAVVFAMAGPTLAAPLIGTCIDMLDKRRALIIVEGGTGVVVLALLFVNDVSDLWVLFGVAVWVGLAALATNAAILGFAQCAVPHDEQPKFNSWLVTIRQGLRLVGPPLGAAMYTAFGGKVVAVADAATCVGAIGILFAIRVPTGLQPEAREHDAPGYSGPALLRGLAVIQRVSTLRVVTATLMLCSAAFGLVETVFFEIARIGLHRPTAFVGVLVGAQGVGAIVGGVACPLILTRVTSIGLLSVGCLVGGGGFALMGVPQLTPVVVGVFLVGLALAFANVPALTLIEQASPRALIGRVSTAFDMLTTVPYIICIAVGAAAAVAVPYRVPLTAMVILCVLASAYSWSRSGSSVTHA